jgi:hypothetical protein
MSCCPGPDHGCAFDPDREGPSEDDIARFNGETADCPSCGEAVYDQAGVCQACGHVFDPTGSVSKFPKAAVGVIAVAVVVGLLVLTF